MGEELISVVIPIYNTADYLGQCIESVQNQTYRNLEIILVDDGSTDGSGEICDRYAQGDPRIRVIHRANGGNNSARKAGIEASVGKYIGFVDSDDWIEPVMYERMAEEAKANSADITVLQQWFREIGVGGNTAVDSASLKGGVYDTYEARKELMSHLFYYGGYGKPGLNASLCNVLFERKLLIKYYNKIPDDVQSAEDNLLLYVCAVNAKSICLLEEKYYHYRARDNSVSRSVRKNMLLNAHLLYKCFREAFEKSEFNDALVKQLDIWIVKYVLSKINYQMGLKQGISIPLYMFPWELVGKGERIILYGAGIVGQSYHRQIENSQNVTLAAWVDAAADKYNKQGLEVERIENIVKHDFDRIVIAVKLEEVAREIRDRLGCMGIPKYKICWKLPESTLEYFLPYDKYCG